MRKGALLTTLLVSLAGCGEGTSATEAVSINAAQSQALNWLSAASLSGNLGSYQNTTNQVRNVLLDIPLVEELNSENGPCADALADGAITLAYVLSPAQNSNIYVCEAAFDFSNEVLAQVLIHETIHVTGLSDECLVSHIEATIVSVGGGTPFKNGWVDDCSGYDFSGFQFNILDEASLNNGIQWSTTPWDSRYIY